MTVSDLTSIRLPQSVDEVIKKAQIIVTFWGTRVYEYDTGDGTASVSIDKIAFALSKISEDVPAYSIARQFYTERLAVAY